MSTHYHTFRCEYLCSPMHPTDPPGRPNITGLSHHGVGQGRPLEEGQLKRLTCISMGGNPLADLAWFAGDDAKIEDVEPTLKGRRRQPAICLMSCNRRQHSIEYRVTGKKPSLTLAANQLLELSKLSEQEVFTILTGHPVEQ